MLEGRGHSSAGLDGAPSATTLPLLQLQGHADQKQLAQVAPTQQFQGKPSLIFPQTQFGLDTGNPRISVPPGGAGRGLPVFRTPPLPDSGQAAAQTASHINTSPDNAGDYHFEQGSGDLLVSCAE